MVERPRSSTFGKDAAVATQPYRLIWQQHKPDQDGYALVLANSGELDDSRLQELRKLFDYVKISQGLGNKKPKHLNKTAQEQIAAWIEDPKAPLSSHAYKKLSDWFLNEKHGEKETELGYACKCLWSALFRAEPGERLTNPKSPNDPIIPERFNRWWKTQSAWQKF
jgi:hypothetical protein